MKHILRTSSYIREAASRARLKKAKRLETRDSSATDNKGAVSSPFAHLCGKWQNPQLFYRRGRGRI